MEYIENNPTTFSKEVIDSILCPISLERFEEAQTVNCNGRHSFSLISAIAIFGKMKNNECEIPGPCPLCQGRVTAYHPNPALQGLVDAILGVHKGQQHVNKMLEIIRKLKLDFESGITYPLKKSQFVLRGSINKEKYKSLKFCNNQDSLKEIKIFALNVEILEKVPYFTLMVFFKDNDEDSKIKLFEYLKKNGIESIEIDSYGSQLINIFRSPKTSEFISCMKLLIEANEFEKESQAKLGQFLEFCETFI